MRVLLVNPPHPSIGRQVWPYEIRHFIFCDRRRRHGPTLAEFWRPAQNAENCNSLELPFVLTS